MYTCCVTNSMEKLTSFCDAPIEFAIVVIKFTSQYLRDSINFSIAMSSSASSYWSIDNVKSPIHFKPLTELNRTANRCGVFFHGRPFEIKLFNWLIRWLRQYLISMPMDRRFGLQMPSNAKSMNRKQKLIALLDSNVNAICHQVYDYWEYASIDHSFIRTAIDSCSKW